MSSVGWVDCLPGCLAISTITAKSSAKAAGSGAWGSGMTSPLTLQAALKLIQQLPDLGDLGSLVLTFPSSAAGLTRAPQVLRALLLGKTEPLMLR